MAALNNLETGPGDRETISDFIDYLVLVPTLCLDKCEADAIYRSHQVKTCWLYELP